MAAGPWKLGVFRKKVKDFWEGAVFFTSFSVPSVPVYFTTVYGSILGQIPTFSHAKPTLA